jgi:predicted peroxiredoxin
MKLVKTLLLMLVLFSFSNMSVLHANALAKGDGVFIHISSGFDNPHKVLMALTLALKMADDHDVFIYMDIKAPEVVLNSAKSIEMNKFEHSKILINKLVEKGVKIAVCTTCLEVLNRSQYDLMKGISIAEKESFFNFTSGRIVSFSY